MDTQFVPTVVIGGGQAGLSVGYHLKRHNIPFVILDARPRVGDPWRSRWDSLRLFTPARFDGLDGMPFPAPPHHFPTKDEMADYLESYCRRFDLPVHTGVRVEKLTRRNGHFLIAAGDFQLEAANVVVAMSNYQEPRIPSYARDLDPDILQLHSKNYRGPSQLKTGGVLLVGAGNSGAEIAVEVVRSHPTWLSGRDVGHIPFDIAGLLSQWFLTRLVFRVVFHRLLTADTFLGRKARPKVLTLGGPLIRQRPSQLEAAGIKRVPRVMGVRDGKPLLDDHTVLDVRNVIWCTGFSPGFSWIDLPVVGDHEPDHVRGCVEREPGLYFVGLHFLYSFSSSMIHGVGRDAEYVVRDIASRQQLLVRATVGAKT